MSYNKFNLDYISYTYYNSSHYVYRYLAHHPWWQNVYAASAARVLSRPRQGPPSDHCECQSLCRGRDRSHAACPATQGEPRASWDHPGRDHVEARHVFWCRVDRVPRRATLGDRKGPGHNP